MEYVHNKDLKSSCKDWPRHMQRALDLAETVLTAGPNPRVGCVLMRDGQVISEGWHSAAGAPHAEAMALDEAGSAARNAVAFVSLEPCAHHGKTGPCSEALIAAGVSKVVIPMQDPHPAVSGKGIAQLEEAGVEVIMMVDFEHAARAINPGFLSRVERGRPRVRMKLAMSLDGRTALFNGESKWITDGTSRRDVQLLRACSCAVLTGVGTVISDDPSLTVRPDEIGLSADQKQCNALNLHNPPLRVVLDSTLRTPAQSKLLEAEGSVLIFSTASAQSAELGALDRCALKVAGSDAQVQLLPVLESLASEYYCNDVLIEAGPTLCGAFLRANLVDELIVYVAPKLMGSDGKALLDLHGIQTMADTPTFELIETKQLEGDVKLRLLPRIY